MLSIQDELTSAVRDYQSGLGLDETPVNIEAFASYLGVKEITYRPLGNDAFVITDQGSAYVVVNSRSPLVRQRFSLAHELGHLFMNQQKGKFGGDCHRLDARGIKSDNVEKLCDAIAAEILMPRHTFIQRASLYNPGLQAVAPLAAEFQASIQATSLRMVDVVSQPWALGYWKLPKSGAPVRRPKWFKQNKIAKHNLKYSGFAGAQRIIPMIEQAFLTGRVTSGQDLVRTNQHGHIGSCYAEAKKFGTGENSFVLSLSYLDIAP